MLALLSDFNPMYAFTSHFAPKRMRSYLVNFEDDENWNNLTDQEKSRYSMDYLEEKFQEIADKNPEIFSERLTRPEETIRRINLSVAEKVREDNIFTPL